MSCEHLTCLRTENTWLVSWTALEKQKRSFVIHFNVNLSLFGPGEKEKKFGNAVQGQIRAISFWAHPFLSLLPLPSCYHFDLAHVCFCSYFQPVGLRSTNSKASRLRLVCPLQPALSFSLPLSSAPALHSYVSFCCCIVFLLVCMYRYIYILLPRSSCLFPLSSPF